MNEINGLWVKWVFVLLFINDENDEMVSRDDT